MHTPHLARLVAGRASASVHALVCMVAGCSSQDARFEPPSSVEVGGHTAALLGGLSYDTETSFYDNETLKSHVCSADEQAGLRQSAILARTVVRSRAFAECVELITTGPIEHAEQYTPCAGDPGGGAQSIINAARHANPIQLVCARGDVSGCAPVRDYGHGGGDTMAIGAVEASRILGEPDFASRITSVLDAADSMVHEGLHSHGYNDISGGCKVTGRTDATYAAEYCVAWIVERSLARCDMRSCGDGANLSLISSFKRSPDTAVGCECVRDHSSLGSHVPASPILSANEGNDQFAAASASGDFDGDGFTDLAVGAPGEDGGEGRVFLYRGTAFGLYPWRVIDQYGMDTNEAGDAFGTSLAVGKFDGDWYDDLAVGAPGEDQRTGAVYLFRGRADIFSGDGYGLAPVRKLRQTGLSANTPGDSFGYSLAVGEVMGNNEDALIVGVPNETVDGKNDAGAVLVFRPVNDPMIMVESAAFVRPRLASVREGALFGWSITADNLDANDLIDDLIIGAPQDATSGAVYVVKGRSSDDDGVWIDSARLRPQGDDAGLPILFGYSVTTSDIVGTTIVVGAPYAASGNGKLYVYRDERASGGTINLHQAIPGDARLGTLGISVARGRRADEIFAAESGNGGGRVLRLGRVFWGGLPLALEQEVLDQSGRGLNESGDRFGAHITLGDFDADGDQDLIVGTPGEAPGSDPVSGAFFTFRTDEPNGNLVPWTAYTQAE